jgi:hypothetical protein
MKMPIANLFSKRQKQLRGEVPDVFQYKEFPEAFRVQVVHILRDALGEPDQYNKVMETFQTIHDILAREYGEFYLSEEVRRRDYQTAVFNFFLNCYDYERVLDVIEFTFRVVEIGVRENWQYKQTAKIKMEADEAVKELNLRFLEHGIGYQFEAGKIIRMDSQLTHAEIVKPTLEVLSNKQYTGANEEFLKAHEHYRHGRYKECLNECLKAFESTMKTICDKRRWKYNSTDTAKGLIDICFQKGLIPAYLQSQFSSLRASLVQVTS